jgi:acid phosphatase
VLDSSHCTTGRSLRYLGGTALYVTMSTLTPRDPYTQEELDRLYPKGLKLQLVQVLLRHGERSPVTARFRNAGLAPYWPYCGAAKKLSSIQLTNPDWPRWDYLQWRRRIETFDTDDSPVIAAGPDGELDGVCQLGELTDKGRETTLELGRRLRHLYVDQLRFMPQLISDADMIYLRATPMPRALESVQQTFWGFYPETARTASFPPPTIITRTAAEETLFPNESNCRRFSQLSRAFAQRTAERWNDSKEMDYINKLIGKWMPETSPRVAVDSHPRLSGIMDTMNSTLAHGQPTRLPKEFYDPTSKQYIEKIGCEEWFSGFQESREYRKVGIGGLVGDIVGRMMGSVEHNGKDGLLEVGSETGALAKGRGGEKGIKFALNGCHDTTLAAVMSSFGCFEGGAWPPYTSHIALELFRNSGAEQTQPNMNAGRTSQGEAARSQKVSSQQQSWWVSMFGGAKQTVGAGPQGIGRKTVDELRTEEKDCLEGYYVRMRYNDQVMTIP